MSRPEEVAQVLEDAADPREHNWQQGAYGVGDGPFCAIGAIRKAAGSQWIRENEVLCDFAVEALHNAVAAPPPGPANVIKWNDAEDQSLENVVATMRRTAAGLR